MLDSASSNSAHRSALARALIAVVVLPLALGSSGCGILLQTMFGWSEEETKRNTVSHTVRVESQPAGASVSRQSSEGNTQDLGTTPLTDTISYEQEKVYSSPKTLGLIIGGVISIGAGIGMAVAGAGESGDFVEGDGAGFGLLFLGGTSIYFGLQDLAIALIYGLAAGGLQETRTVGSPTYTYTGHKAGAPNEAKELVTIPNQSRVTLVLDGSATEPVVSAPPPPPGSPPPPSGGGKKISAEVENWVIAVMNVEDVNAGTLKAVDNGLIRNLGDQLRIFLAQQGAKTIDRSAQERALREAIADAKSESYKACYDDSCQIELGKALAASHILRSRITRFGSRCVLNAELIDLRSEVTVKAASSRGGCEAEGFLNMSEDVAESIIPSS